MVGLSFGSFANMWQYRHHPKLGKKRRQLSNRSVCDFCGRPLSWRHNLPIVSFLIQRGKSACCHRPLPLDYPLVEALGGLIGWLAGQAWWRLVGFHGLFFDLYFWLSLAIVLAMVLLSLIILAYDLNYLLIPIKPALAWLALAIGFNLLGSQIGFVQGLLASIASMSFLVLLYLVTKGRGMGLGDAVLVFIFGWLLGFLGSLFSLWLTFVTGALVGIGLVLVNGKTNLKSLLPLGPFLILSFWLSWPFQWWQILIQWIHGV